MSEVRLKPEDQELVDSFHRFYYGNYWRLGVEQRVHAPLTDVRWMGTICQKFPSDLFVFQEILWDTRPNLIIECGTCAGGTTLFLASCCELLRHGEVVTIDKDKLPRALHPGITWLVGDTLDEQILDGLRKWAMMCPKVMVILDDDHSKEHVLKEMEVYGQLVTPGCYLIVEDTNVNGHPVFPNHGPGPWEAVHEFLPNHPEFAVDPSREHFGLTYNPDGYLLKVR